MKMDNGQKFIVGMLLGFIVFIIFVFYVTNEREKTETLARYAAILEADTCYKVAALKDNYRQEATMLCVVTKGK